MGMAGNRTPTMRQRPLPSAVIIALLLAGAATSPAESPAPHASPGLYEATSHWSFEDVESWTKVFDDPKRDAWQKPAAVVDALGLTAGMRVADIGAGTGYFSRYLAAAVGPTGAVFAV